MGRRFSTRNSPTRGRSRATSSYSTACMTTCKRKRLISNGSTPRTKSYPISCESSKKSSCKRKRSCKTIRISVQSGNARSLKLNAIIRKRLTCLRSSCSLARMSSPTSSERRMSNGAKRRKSYNATTISSTKSEQRSRN